MGCMEIWEENEAGWKSIGERQFQPTVIMLMKIDEGTSASSAVQIQHSTSDQLRNIIGKLVLQSD